MRIVTIALLAAAGLAIAAPASAEDVIVGGRVGPVGVGVDVGPRVHRDVVVERRVHRDRDFARGNCRTTIIHRDGMTKKIKSCD